VVLIQVLPSRVNLWGDKGPVSGIFGHPAIHISYRKKDADLDSILLMWVHQVKKKLKVWVSM
jgi:hypothetical protein